MLQSDLHLYFKKVFRMDFTKYSEFDRTNYFGRLRWFIRITNPIQCLTLTPKKILEAKKIVNSHVHSGTRPSPETFYSKRIVDSVFHPTSKRKIPFFWRMYSFAPLNCFILYGMVSATSVPMTILWQVVNQTNNCLTNWFNRSTADRAEATEILRNYGIAVGSSVSIAVSLNRWIVSASGFDPRMKTLLLALLVPWGSVSFANMVNISVTRSQEITKGTTVYDSNNNYLGLSKIAGRRAVALTVAARVANGTMILGLNHVLSRWLVNREWLIARPKVHPYFEMLVAFSVLTFALPISLAIFPQRQKIHVKKTEKNIRKNFSSTPQTEQSNKYVYFNKGL